MPNVLHKNESAVQAPANKKSSGGSASEELAASPLMRRKRGESVFTRPPEGSIPSQEPEAAEESLVQAAINDPAKKLQKAIGHKNIYGPGGLEAMGRDNEGKALEQKAPKENVVSKEKWDEKRAAFKEQFVRLLSDVPKADIPGRMGATLEAAADTVFDDLMQKTIDSIPTMKELPKDQNGYDRVAAVNAEEGAITGAQGKYAEALSQVEGFANELKELVKKSKKAKDLAANGFAFWSGRPAKEAAADSGLQSLEGSALGGMFEHGVSPSAVNMSWWGGISKAFAEWAAEDIEGKTYKGFVGVGGGRIDNIYNSVERWTFEAALGGRKAPTIEWYAVVPIQVSYDHQAKTGKYYKGNLYSKEESIVKKYKSQKADRKSRQSAVNAAIIEDENRQEIAQSRLNS